MDAPAALSTCYSIVNEPKKLLSVLLVVIGWTLSMCSFFIYGVGRQEHIVALCLLIFGISTITWYFYMHVRRVGGIVHELVKVELGLYTLGLLGVFIGALVLEIGYIMEARRDDGTYALQFPGLVIGIISNFLWVLMFMCMPATEQKLLNEQRKDNESLLQHNYWNKK